jgi:DNA-binding transcriptional regulator YiaG
MILLQSHGATHHAQFTGSGLFQVFKPVGALPQGFGTGSYPYSGELIDFLVKLYSSEHTSSGGCLSVDQDLDLPTSKAIHELRFKTGLSWDRLSRLFGVQRRSLHFWASGKPLSEKNEERLYHLLALVRTIDRGSARANRTLLLKPIENSDSSPFDLLLQDKFEEVRERLDVAQTRRRRPPQANPDQIRDKMPPSLTGFDAEIDDTPISSSGRVRVAKARKVRRGQLL